MRKSLLFLLLSISFYSFAQKEDPTSWHTSLSKPTVAKGETLDLIFTADIQENWYLYSSDFDKELGPVVAEFNFSPNESYELVGGIKPIGAKSKTDNEIWMGTYTYFTKKAEFRQTVKIVNDHPAIKVKLNAQACTDLSGKCVPVIKQFTFNDIQVKGAVASSENSTKTPVQVVEPVSNKTPSPNPVKEAPPTTTSGSKLEDLKQEKSKLVKTNTKGQDQAVVELKEFVKKYGN